MAVVPAVPVVALLSDFGLRDGYPGVMKGVILGIAPGTALVDLTHEIPPQDIRTGAWVLHTAWRSFPEGCVFLCVVDPGVGGARRPIALQTGGRYFVGPDNGLFSYPLANAKATRATDAQAVMLDNPRYFPPAPSMTFHGRDIFAPAAGWLAAGVPLDQLGQALATDSLSRLELPRPEWRPNTLAAHIVHIDHFGNILTDVEGPWARAVFTAPAPILTIAGRSITARARTFAEGPESALFLYLDSSSHLAIAQRNGSAAAALELSSAALFTQTLTISGIEPYN
jgi:S-adenosylmethionine hydrolase